MTPLYELLERIRDQRLAQGRFRGLLYVLIGRRLLLGETVLSQGLTWREVASLLKKLRWPPEAVRELGIDPAELPPRDREKFWYQAINRAALTDASARQQGEELIAMLAAEGYQLGD
ncbi:MAG: hypothetical protein SNJ75_07575 [Gemmataceae bacterium]